MIKIIASDLDGTFLNKNGKIPSEFIHVFKIIKEKNIKFIAASGRPYYTLKKDFENLYNDIIFITDNGATIVENNILTYSITIDNSLVKELIDEYRKLKDVFIILCGKECAYIEDNSEVFLQEVDKYFYKKQVVENISDVKDEILKVTFCNFEDINAIANKYFLPKFQNSLQIVSSGSIWLDIMNKNATKGNALKRIQEKYAITKGETMVFGDYFNDISLFDKAHFSYAMSSSPDFVKKKAKFVLEASEDNEVLNIIKDKLI